MVYLNDGTGHFTKESTNRFAALLPSAPYWTVQVVDADGDGLPDVLVGGYEWVVCPTCGGRSRSAAPTTVLLSQREGGYRAVKLPAVAGEGTVMDFVVTGASGNRAIWVDRTSGDTNVDTYLSRTLQRVSWPDLVSTVPLTTRSSPWVPWIIPATNGTTLSIVSDNARDGFTPITVP